MERSLESPSAGRSPSLAVPTLWAGSIACNDMRERIGDSFEDSWYSYTSGDGYGISDWKLSTAATH